MANTTDDLSGKSPAALPFGPVASPSLLDTSQDSISHMFGSPAVPIDDLAVSNLSGAGCTHLH